MMGIGAFPWALWALDKLATKKEKFVRDLVEVDFEKVPHGTLHASHCSVKADFHSVQNVARSIFCDRFLLKCVQSTTANEICSA